MNTNKQFSIVAMVLIFLYLVGLFVIVEEDYEKTVHEFSSKDMYVELPEIVYSPPPEPEKIDMLEYSRRLR